MTQAEYDLFLGPEAGPAVLRPTESGPAGRDTFQGTILLLLELRARGWIRLPDGRITRDGDGKAMAGRPCDLTAAGRRALEDDRGLRPRPLGPYMRTVYER
jgi:hypothetical protein